MSRKTKLLTSTQLLILNFVLQHQRQEGASPTRDEIRVGLGLSGAGAVGHYLQSLQRRGCIRLRSEGLRDIEVLPAGLALATPSEDPKSTHKETQQERPKSGREEGPGDQPTQAPHQQLRSFMARANQLPPSARIEAKLDFLLEILFRPEGTRRRTGSAALMRELAKRPIGFSVETVNQSRGNLSAAADRAGIKISTRTLSATNIKITRIG